MRIPIPKSPVLLAVLLAMVVLPPQQLALCVGEDGHRELELLSAVCCPPGAEHDSRDDFEAEADNCAPDCIDTPISTADATGISSPSTNLLPDCHTTPNVFGISPADGSTVLASNSVRGRYGPPDVVPIQASKIARTTVRRL